MKKIMLLIMSLLLVASAFAIGEQTENLIQEDVGDYTYTNSDVDMLEGDINYQYIAFYEGSDGEVRVDVYELSQAEDAQELYSEALQDGTTVDVTNIQLGYSNDVRHTLFWNSERFFVSIRFPEDVSESDMLLQDYLSKYPVDVEVEDSTETSLPTVLIEEDVGDYRFVSEDEDLLPSGDRSFHAFYEIYGMEANVEVRVLKNSGEAESLFEQEVEDESMEIVRVANMEVAKLVREAASGNQFQYMWHSGNKIVIMKRLQWGIIRNDLLVLEYLSKYQSEVGISDGIPEPPVEVTPVTPEEPVEGHEPGTTEAPVGSTCPGCEVEDNCLDRGFRMLSGNVPSYCGFDNQLHTQKNVGEFCQNNFECSSNQCSNSQCIDLSGQLEETQSLLQKILAWLKTLFG